MGKSTVTDQGLKWHWGILYTGFYKDPINIGVLVFGGELIVMVTKVEQPADLLIRVGVFFGVFGM